MGPCCQVVTLFPLVAVAVSVRETLPSVGWLYPADPGVAELVGDPALAQEPGAAGVVRAAEDLDRHVPVQLQVLSLMHLHIKTPFRKLWQREYIDRGCLCGQDKREQSQKNQLIGHCEWVDGGSIVFFSRSLPGFQWSRRKIQADFSLKYINVC